MEFLDPKDKRTRTIKLFTGYILIAILIGLATMILVYLAQGYGYNPSKGVSRNGLLFVDSAPVSASVLLNGQEKAKTNTRLTVAEGIYDVTLNADEYRSWNKTITIEGGVVSYLLYPRLFPVDIPLNIVQTFTTPPLFAVASPDRHWLVAQVEPGTPRLLLFDLQKPDQQAVTVTLPAAQLLSDAAGNTAAFTPIEWSDDNQHLLLKQTLGNGQTAYVVYDRDDATKTVNTTKQIALPAGASLSLRDKKYDKYYVFTAASGAIQTADTKSGIQAAPLVSGAVAFKSFSDNLLLYVSYTGAQPTDADFYIQRDGRDTFKLQSLPRDPNNQYLLDIAQYEGDWFYVTASKSDTKALMYRDPLNKAKAGDTTPLSPRLAFGITNPQFTSFSDNARFIGLQSGKQFVVYDAELGRVYRYTTPLAIADGAAAKWMDGHRFTVVAENTVYAFDFDGTNIQALTASRPEFNSYFDRDYKYIFTFMQQVDGRTALQTGKLVL